MNLLIILALIFSFLPALLWIIFWYRKDSLQPEPKRMVFLAFLFGMLSALPFGGVQFVFERSIHLQFFWNLFSEKSFFVVPMVTLILLAFTEELFKHFMVLRLGKRLGIYFDQIVDGIVYALSVGLGFAFFENILYLSNALFFLGVSEGFWQIFLFRSLGTTLAHGLFSGIFGYFWGYAMFSEKICKHHTISVSTLWHGIKNALSFHLILHHVLPANPCPGHHEKAELVREAFFLSVFLHVVFNLLLKIKFFGNSLTPLIVPFLLVLLIWLSHRFLPKKIHKYGKPCKKKEKKKN